MIMSDHVYTLFHILHTKHKRATNDLNEKGKEEESDDLFFQLV